MYHIIINPASRSGKGLKIWKEIVEPALHEKGCKYRSHFSQAAGDVARLAGEILSSDTSASSHPVTLIILGGDGTVNEALQGICDLSRVIIGYIPTGSSNDLARDLGIPRDPLKALDAILHTGSLHSMDLGTVHFTNGDKRHFAVSCGIGFDAAVCEEALRSRIKAVFNAIGLGKLTYLGIALKQLLTARAVSCQIQLEGRETVQIRKLLFTAIMIHQYEGGGFLFCPGADCTDGISDLCVVGDVPKPMLLVALPTAFWGKHYMVKGVTAYRSPSVHVKTNAPLWIHTDGEVSRKTDEFTVTCQKKALTMIF